MPAHVYCKGQHCGAAIVDATRRAAMCEAGLLASVLRSLSSRHALTTAWQTIGQTALPIEQDNDQPVTMAPGTK
jgi:hypothetical protein